MTISSALVIDTEGLDPETIDQIRRAVAHILAEAGDFEPPAGAVAGWTEDAAAELHTRLVRINRPVQAKVIAVAAHTGGFVDRATVYELGGYPDNRSLKGWSRPVNRLVNSMISERRITPDALIPLTAVYDPQNPSFQQTKGFQMPAELVELFARAVQPPAPRTR
jgi:hypothetical protein